MIGLSVVPPEQNTVYIIMLYLFKQQALFSYPASFAYCSSVTGLRLPSLMMRRNATVLIIMSLLLARLSLGGCEPQFGETKALISKALWSVSLLSLCPLSQSSYNLVPHYLPSWPCSFFVFFFWACLDCYTSFYYRFSSWSINVLVGNFVWCNNEEILSGLGCVL